MADRARKPEHFARLGVLVDGGWLAVLTRAELAMWVLFSKHADNADGTCHPGNELIATRLGLESTGHVSRTRKKLVEKGLIEIVEKGCGRGNFCTVKLLTPPTSPKEAKGCHPEHLFAPADEAERVPNRPVKGADLNAKGCRFEQSLNKEELLLELPELSKASATESRGPSGTVTKSNGAGATKPGKRKAQRKLSDEQQAVREAFSDWWTRDAWPSRNGGVEYEFEGSRDGRAVMQVLGSKFVAWDLDRAKLVARVFLAEPDVYLARRGHVLYDLGERLSRFVSMAARMKGDRDGTQQPDPYALPIRRYGTGG